MYVCMYVCTFYGAKKKKKKKKKVLKRSALLPSLLRATDKGNIFECSKKQMLDEPKLLLRPIFFFFFSFMMQVGAWHEASAFCFRPVGLFSHFWKAKKGPSLSYQIACTEGQCDHSVDCVRLAGASSSSSAAAAAAEAAPSCTVRSLEPGGGGIFHFEPDEAIKVHICTKHSPCTEHAHSDADASMAIKRAQHF